MLSRLALIAISSLLFGGCMMMGHDCEGRGMCGGGSGSAAKSAEPPPTCASDAQCATGQYCDLTAGACRQGTPCAGESDCAAGENCDAARALCLPSSEPTCGELGSEAECGARSDCKPIYAGIECSCGADCTCQGGEPGCVCQSFEFFRCADATP